MSNNASEQPSTQEQIPNIPLSKQEPIEESRNTMISEKKQIKELVEAPLLKACEDLYDKNIRTLATSANKKDLLPGYAHIIIEVDSMSPENKFIASEIADEKGGEITEYDKRQALILHIPVDNATLTTEIEEVSMEIAAKFKKQPLTWAPIYTVGYLKKAYGMEISDTEYDDPQGWIDSGYYYDKGSNRFFLSEEHYKKVNELL